MPDTVYFFLNIGVWTGGAAYSIDVAVDELSLVPAGSSVDDRQDNVPDQFALFQNYHNPFNPQITISYVLSRGSTVTLRVYDTLGREVATLLNQDAQTSGRHEIAFDAVNIPSGIYFYKLTTGYGSFVREMTLLK